MNDIYIYIYHEMKKMNWIKNILYLGHFHLNNFSGGFKL